MIHVVTPRVTCSGSPPTPRQLLLTIYLSLCSGAAIITSGSVDKLEPKTSEKLVPDFEVSQMKKLLDAITVSPGDVDERPLALGALRGVTWNVSNSVFNVNVIHTTQPKKGLAATCKKQMIHRNIMQQWGEAVLKSKGKALPGYVNYARVPAKDFAFEAAATRVYQVGQCHGMAFLLGADIKARFPSATVTVSNICVPISHVLVLVAMKVNKKKAYYYCDAWTEPPAVIPLSGKDVYTRMKGDVECDSFDVPAPKTFLPLMQEYQSLFYMPWPKTELNPFTWPANNYHLHPDIIKKVGSVCAKVKFKSGKVPQIEACSPETIATYWEEQE